MEPNNRVERRQNVSMSVNYQTAPISYFEIQTSVNSTDVITLETFVSPPGETGLQVHLGWRVVLNSDNTLLSIDIEDAEGQITTVLLSSDEALVLSPRQKSRWSWTELAKCHVVELPRAYIQRLSGDASNQLEKEYIGLLHVKAPRLLESIGLAHSSLIRSEAGSHNVAKSFVDASAFRLLRAIDEGLLSKTALSGTDVPQDFSSNLPQSILEAISRTRRTPNQNITLNDMIKTTGFSRSKLIRIFKSAVGEPPMAYLRRVRVEEALSRLQLTQQPIAEIAMECGFCDQAHLSNVMKSMLGFTPGSVR